MNPNSVKKAIGSLRDELYQLAVERKNLVARWGPSDETAALILNGHIDVVPPGEREQWDAGPFDARIHQDALHGRGSCDMKGGLAACCIAVRAAMKLGIEPKRSILVQSVAGEARPRAEVFAHLIATKLDT